MFIVHLENSLVFRNLFSGGDLSVLITCICFCDSLQEFEIGFGVLEHFGLFHLQDSIFLGEAYHDYQFAIHFNADCGFRLDSELGGTALSAWNIYLNILWTNVMNDFVRSFCEGVDVHLWGWGLRLGKEVGEETNIAYLAIASPDVRHPRDLFKPFICGYLRLAEGPWVSKTTKVLMRVFRKKVHVPPLVCLGQRVDKFNLRGAGCLCAGHWSEVIEGGFL